MYISWFTGEGKKTGPPEPEIFPSEAEAWHQSSVDPNPGNV